jgi:hypothetical protein
MANFFPWDVTLAEFPDYSLPAANACGASAKASKWA